MSAGTPFTDERVLVLSVPVDMAWGELDAFGHANNVAYFRWLETARMHYLRSIGLTHPDEQEGIGLLLAETRCRFLKPLTFPDRLAVRCGVCVVKNTSFVMHYRITSDRDGLAAEGESVQVMFNYRTNTKIPIPAAIRARIEHAQRTPS
jgi:acyl-CoA thioester hydrolase